MARIAISNIRRVVDSEINSSTRGRDESTVDLIVKEFFGLTLTAVQCGDGITDDGNPRLLMPSELQANYDDLREEWKASHNFPWRLKIVTVEGENYYLGYVSEMGLADTPAHLFERIIHLYPVDKIDANA